MEKEPMQGMPTLAAWMADLRGKAPCDWQVAWWTQWQEHGFPQHWMPPGPWSETEICDLLVLWLAHEVARGGRRQLVWATGRRGGERPFFLAAREMAEKLSQTETGVLGHVSGILRRAAKEAGGNDPLAVIGVNGYVTGRQSWLPPGQPGILAMDLHDLVAGLLFRANGVEDGQAPLVAAGLASAAAWVVVDTVVPLAAWQTLTQLRDTLAGEPGATDTVQLGCVSTGLSLPMSLATGKDLPLKLVSTSARRFIADVSALVSSIVNSAKNPESSRRDPVLVIVNDAVTALALKAAVERTKTGPVQVISGQEPRWMADANWQALSKSPEKAAVWILSDISDVVGLPLRISHLMTEVAAWDVLGHRIRQWQGDSPVVVMGGHQTEGPGVYVWQTLYALSLTDGADRFVRLDGKIDEQIQGELSALRERCVTAPPHEAAAMAVAAGWSPEGFQGGLRMTSGVLDLAVQTMPRPYPDCPVGQAVWGEGAGGAEVGVLWRPELDSEPPELWPGIIRQLPPCDTEGCRVDAGVLCEWLQRGQWGRSPGRVGRGNQTKPPGLTAGRGLIYRSTGRVEIFGLPSPLGHVSSSVELCAGDTVVLPASHYPEVLGAPPRLENLIERLREAGRLAYALGPHIPGLETFPWRRWWRLVQRRRIHQKRLFKWMAGLASHWENIGQPEMAGQLRRVLSSGTPAALWPLSDGCQGWVSFPWASLRRPGDGEPLPPGIAWRVGEPLGPRPVISTKLVQILDTTIQAHARDITSQSMKLAGRGLALGMGYLPLCQTVLAFGNGTHSRSERMEQTSSPAENPEPDRIICPGTSPYPLINGRILAREPGSAGWEMDTLGDALAVWDGFPWEFLSVAALMENFCREDPEDEDKDMAPQMVELALHLVGAVRGLGRPLPSVPGQGQIGRLAAVADAPISLVGSTWKRFWQMQQRWGRWGCAIHEARWRWMVWRWLRDVAGVATINGG